MPDYSLRMTLDQIIAELQSADGIPADALRAGVAHADALAPIVYDLVEKVCRGSYPMPDERGMFFHGLHILAAARHPGLYPHVLSLARLPEEELEDMFVLHAPTTLTQLMLSVWDGDADALFRTIEHADMPADGKWALFDVLSRLTFDGRIPRECTQAFLERFERDGLAGDKDEIWWGWQGAVQKLGLRDLEPALRRSWSKDICKNFSDKDHAEGLQELERAASNPADPAVFDELNLSPVGDPADAMAWLDRRDAVMAAWRAEDGLGEDVEEDIETDAAAAAAVRLTAAEQEWLSGFLTSRQVPPTAMTFEMLDGFLTCLVIGPALLMPSQYMPVIWGTDDGGGPIWEGKKQLEFFMGLLMRHWNAIAARVAAHALHRPCIPGDGRDAGADWAQGFFDGVDMDQSGWEPLMVDKSIMAMLMPIYILSGLDPEVPGGRPDPEAREEIIETLPSLVNKLAGHVREFRRHGPRNEPARSAKVGRNEPCPCGSGKKFKKCCLGGGSPMVH